MSKTTAHTYLMEGDSLARGQLRGENLKFQSLSMIILNSSKETRARSKNEMMSASKILEIPPFLQIQPSNLLQYVRVPL